MDLLERARALDELGRLTLEAASGAGRLVLVGGEAGVGKTSLVRQFTRALPGKVRALWGGCDPLSLPRPLGPLVDVAPALGPEFERMLEAEVPRPRLFAAVRDALQASMHILVFEDAHWADDATLDLLRYLGRRMDTTRSLVIVTYRDDEVGPKHPLRGDPAHRRAEQAARRPHHESERARPVLLSLRVAVAASGRRGANRRAPADPRAYFSSV